MMENFSKHFDDLQASILSNAYHRGLGRPCACGAAEAIFRCAGAEKCSDPPLQCKSCIVQSHQSLPFHRIEAWSGTHFIMSSLHALGFVLYLGHHGERCPNLSITHPRPMTAVHTNGFHKFGVQFCHCEGGASQAIQLSDHGYFPGTMVQPETVFSFGVLENFHAHTLSSKKSLYDYHDALVKMTNAAFPQDVPVRATESLSPSVLISIRVDIRNSVKLLAYGPTLQFGGGQAKIMESMRNCLDDDPPRSLCAALLALKSGSMSTKRRLMSPVKTKRKLLLFILY